MGEFRPSSASSTSLAQSALIDGTARMPGTFPASASTSRPRASSSHVNSPVAASEKPTMPHRVPRMGVSTMSRSGCDATSRCGRRSADATCHTTVRRRSGSWDST